MVAHSFSLTPICYSSYGTIAQAEAYIKLKISVLGTPKELREFVLVPMRSGFKESQIFL